MLGPGLGPRATLLTAFSLLSTAAWLGNAQSAAKASTTPAAITLPAGAKIQVALIRPVWARSASTGESLYAQTTFPVTAGDRVAIPPGTYVEGRLEKLTRPTRRSNRAELRILFTRFIFANSYAAALPGADIGAGAAAAATSGAAPTQPTSPAETLIAVSVQVGANNDLLLDNGAPIEITLAAPIELDAQQVAAAVPVSRAPVPGQFKTATACRPTPGTPGTPGTPDTVIPGTPGTPDTVIPGGPGMPDTVIPGTPSTPDTVIPGSPGTPGWNGTSCPSPPLVLSSTPVNAQSS